MKNFHIKSIILGMGIGVVLTSILSIIYLAGMDPSQKMTREEIIREAEKLGMVKGNTVDNSKASSETNNTTTKPPETKDTAMVTPAPQETVTPVPTSSPGPSSVPTVKPAQTPSVTSTPAPSTANQPVMVVINYGERAEEVADKLVAAKLIKNKYEFINELNNQGLTTKIIYGNYYIMPGTDMKTIINQITFLNLNH